MATTGPASVGERQVAAYLRQQRLRATYEDEIGGRRPDFHVFHPSQEFALEVYEPEIELPEGGGWFDSYPALRGAFRDRKQDQASAARRAGVPFVVAITGTRSAVGIVPTMVAGAAFGNIGVTFPIGPAVNQISAEDVPLVFGSGGRLQEGINRGVSAVAIPMSFNPTEWCVEAVVTERMGNVTDAYRPGMSPGANRRLMAQFLRAHQEARQHASATGTFDETARVIRVVVLHNPHAQFPLDQAVFVCPHDEQWWLGADDFYGPRFRGRLIHEYDHQFVGVPGATDTGR